MNRLFDVRGLHVLITGATKGIGRMIVDGFHGADAVVYVSSRSPEDCDRVVAALGRRAVAVPSDVSTLEGCRDLADRMSHHTDRLHVLINNAGTTWGAEIEDYPDSAWDKVLAVNLKAPFHLTVALLDLLRAAGNPENPSRVINVGSVDGFQVPMWESYAYSSSKAGLHHLTRHLAKRLARDHITVNAIAPGLFETKMTRFAFAEGGGSFSRPVPMGRFGRSEDVAGAAIFLSSAAASWVTGVVLPVDGGWATLR